MLSALLIFFWLTCLLVAHLHHLLLLLSEAFHYPEFVFITVLKETIKTVISIWTLSSISLLSIWGLTCTSSLLIGNPITSNRMPSYHPESPMAPWTSQRCWECTLPLCPLSLNKNPDVWNSIHAHLTMPCYSPSPFFSTSFFVLCLSLLYDMICIFIRGSEPPWSVDYCRLCAYTTLQTIDQKRVVAECYSLCDQLDRCHTWWWLDIPIQAATRHFLSAVWVRPRFELRAFCVPRN